MRSSKPPARRSANRWRRRHLSESKPASPANKKGRKTVSMYLNASFEDGERLAVEIATVQGWSDFCRWARSLPPGRFKLLHTLAVRGTCDTPSGLYAEIHAAAKV